jgi:single-strand DNA-binding protein
MSSLNKVILIGYLTVNPELKQTNSGTNVCSFSIGVSRRFKDANGKYQSDFINIVTWRSTAEFVCKYFQKGSAICIVGSIQTRGYQTQSGEKRTAVEVVADEVSFVENKKSDEPQAPEFIPPQMTVPNANFEELPENEDLPF